MTINLPSYIQGQSRGVAQRALANVPVGSPPYLSIMGGRFTLIDAAGNTRAFQTLYADVVVIDVNDHLSKVYFPNNFDPNAADPPLCFSDNGVAPSRNAGQPQSPTCASCYWGEWGSKTSQMGSRVKACADLQKIALIVPGLPGQEFLLRIPPNSLKNWAGYLSTFRNYDVTDVVTRLSFEAGVLGTLQFEPAPDGEAFFDHPRWAQCGLLQCRAQAWANPGVATMIGKSDQPAEGLVGGPGFRGGQIAVQAQPPHYGQSAQPAQIAYQPPAQGQVQQAAPAQLVQPAYAPQQYQQPAPAQPPGPAPQQFQPAPQQPAAQVQPAQQSPQQPVKRRRRAAAPNGQQPAAQTTQQAPQQPGPTQGAAQAPFPHPGAAGQQFQPGPGPAGVVSQPGSAAAGGAPVNPLPSNPAPAFGMQAGQQPSPEMEAMLQQTFGANYRQQ